MKSYYEVSVPRALKVIYKRTVVASSPEEAIRLALLPTAWPIGYDERTIESVDTGPPEAIAIEDAPTLRSWGDPNAPDAPFQVEEQTP